MLLSQLWKIWSTGHLFTDSGEWLDTQDNDVDGTQAPIISTGMPRGPRLASEGPQHCSMELVSRNGSGP